MVLLEAVMAGGVVVTNAASGAEKEMVVLYETKLLSIVFWVTVKGTKGKENKASADAEAYAEEGKVYPSMKLSFSTTENCEA